MTLRGAELLGQADVVLYDGLSNAQLLHHAPGAEHICVGKHGQSRIWHQDEIISEMLRHAQAGKQVARLKGGDPAVFARTAEEIEALREGGISYEIVPGITAALAAGSYAGIPITDRGLASAVALVTGHEEPGKNESALDWDALARFPGTLVVYMGVTTAQVWTGALIDAGKSPDTPVAIIRRCSLPDQQTIPCRLDEVTAQIESNKIRPPAIVIIGLVARLAQTIDWVQRRPLFGQTILVTRPADQAESLSTLLRQRGASVLLQPAIKIGPPNDWNDIDSAINNLGDFDGVVFCSHNGVRYFFDRMLELGADARHFANIQVAVVGIKTAESLREYAIIADVVPEKYRAESLAEKLCSDAEGKHFLIVRASRGRDALSETLKASGADVTQVVAYQHSDITDPNPLIKEMASAKKLDWITVTSSASAESLVKMFGDSFAQMKIASLSPVTSQSVRDLGFHVAAEANPYTFESLVDAIVQKETT